MRCSSIWEIQGYIIKWGGVVEVPSREGKLHQYVGDMIAVQKEIFDMVRMQTGQRMTQEYPNAHATLQKIENTLEGHISELERHMSVMGGNGSGPVKKMAATVLGTAQSLRSRMRAEAVSKMLRDDYTALGLSAISYTMLHTTGLTLNDQGTADLAIRHLKDITPLITELSEVAAEVTAQELVNNLRLTNIDTEIARTAVRNVQEAWMSDHVHSTHTHAW